MIRKGWDFFVSIIICVLLILFTNITVNAQSVYRVSQCRGEGDGRDNSAVLIAEADAVVLCTALTVAKEIFYSELQKEAVVETAYSVKWTTEDRTAFSGISGTVHCQLYKGVREAAGVWRRMHSLSTILPPIHNILQRRQMVPRPKRLAV